MALSQILPLLPPPLQEEIRAHTKKTLLGRDRISEVRLRRGRVASLSVFCDGYLSNIPLSFVADDTAIKSTFSRAVGGSAYAYEREVMEGYLPIGNGVRLGITGRVTQKAGGMLHITAIDTLVFRLPCAMPSAEALFRFYSESLGGILLFAPPGGGKTSLLRAFAQKAAKKERVALIDTREEFDLPSPTLLLDHLCGYPKARGAEIAVRTLSPELLILDEVGAEEAAALATLVSFGVRTVASVHGGDAERLLRTPALAPLFASGMFATLWDVRHSRPTPLPHGGIS